MIGKQIWIKKIKKKMLTNYFWKM